MGVDWGSGRMIGDKSHQLYPWVGQIQTGSVLPGKAWLSMPGMTRKGWVRLNLGGYQFKYKINLIHNWVDNCLFSCINIQDIIIIFHSKCMCFKHTVDSIAQVKNITWFDLIAQVNLVRHGSAQLRMAQLRSRLDRPTTCHGWCTLSHPRREGRGAIGYIHP